MDLCTVQGNNQTAAHTTRRPTASNQSLSLRQVLQQVGKKHENPIQFKFRAKFYPEDVSEIIQESTLVRYVAAVLGYLGCFGLFGQI